MCVFVCMGDLGQVLKDNPLVSSLIKFRVCVCARLCVCLQNLFSSQISPFDGVFF